jgi:hypothetical protein
VLADRIDREPTNLQVSQVVHLDVRVRVAAIRLPIAAVSFAN